MGNVCFKMEITILINKILDSNGWSQAQLAEKLGVSQRTVSSYETGESPPSRRNKNKLEELAISLGIIEKEPEKLKVENDICSDNTENIIEQLIIFKTEARIYKELHLEHLETERQLMQKIEVVLTRFEGFINKENKQGTHNSPATRSHQVTGGL